VAKINRSPVNPNSFGTAVREKTKDFKKVEHFTPHDLRRTAATHIAKLGYGPIVGKILNHTDQSVTAIYDRYSYDQEKQAALTAWGDAIANMIRPTSIICDKEAENEVR
jgi:integrase